MKADSQTFFAQLVPASVYHFLEAMKTIGIKRKIPNISWDTGKFIYETCAAKKPKTMLEIGPANGFSTMMLGLVEGAEVTSIECSRHAFEELRNNLKTFLARHTDEANTSEPATIWGKIEGETYQEKFGQFDLYYADARELLPAFVDGKDEVVCEQPKSTLRNISKKRFDIIFIDGAFRMTREFFDLSLPLLTEGGLIILDDAIKYRWKMDGFHEYLTESGISYELVQTDEDDGVMLIDFSKNNAHN